MSQEMVVIICAIGLFLWNILSFVLYGIDKHKTKRRSRRISEATLLTAAFLMGGIGAVFGMALFRHKTKRLKFKLLVPLAVILNVGVVILLLYWRGII